MADSITTYPNFASNIDSIIPYLLKHTSYTLTTTGSAVTINHSESSDIWIIQALPSLYISGSAALSAYPSIFIAPTNTSIMIACVSAYALTMEITSNTIKLSGNNTYAKGSIICTPIYE